MAVKTHAEQIADLKATREAHEKRMNEIGAKATEDGRTMDAAEQEEFDTLASEIDKIDADVKRFERLEAINKSKATPVAGGKPEDAAASRAGVTVKNTQKAEPGVEFARYAMCLAAARGDVGRAFSIAKNAIPHSDRVVNFLKFQAETGETVEGLYRKTAVAGGTTTDSVWAAPLVDYQNFAGDFVEFLRPQTIVGKFGMDGIPSLRRIPFNVRIHGQTTGGAGYWVGQGAPKPLTKFEFNATELKWAKVAAISVITDELARFSSPSAELLVRQGLADALRARLDIDFIDPSKAAVANVSPASITNALSPISSTGGTEDAVRADLRALWAPFIAANIAPTSAVYIMSQSTALALSLMVNALGQPAFPGITMNGGTLLGVPVIVSEYADNTAGTLGGLVILVNASDVWFADDGGFTLDASREASLQMDDEPTNNASTGTGTSVVSMFQTNSIALRCERYVNWQLRRSAGAAYLDAVTWGT